MTEEDASLLWEENAEAWTQLARMGYDIYRDGCNTPAFLKMLPPVKGLKGLDVGCGEGENTRLVARLGANMTGTDVSPTFIKHSQNYEHERENDPAIREVGARASLPASNPDKDTNECSHAKPAKLPTSPDGTNLITYVVASAINMPFADRSFDFVIATMVLMDIEDITSALNEIHRVLKPAGFFQFSIVHPCFQTPGMRWLFDGSGNRAGVEASKYFQEGRIDDEWTFTAAPEEISKGFKPFRVAHFHRTLSTWIKLVLDAGFEIDAVSEPTPDEEAVKQYPPLNCMREIPLFLHMRLRSRFPLSSPATASD